MKSLILSLCVFLFLAGCSEKKLEQSEAENLIKERISKNPDKTVWFFTGFITDPNYLPLYKAAADGTVLSFKDKVFVKEAGREMSQLSLTEEGKSIAKCEKNRCEVTVCSIVFEKLDKLTTDRNTAKGEYTYAVNCDSKHYKTFELLAKRQFVVPEKKTEPIYFALDSATGKWKIQDR